MSGNLTFGRWLKRRRNELGLTQEEVAEHIGCSPSALQKIENGERRPSGQVAHLLALYLHIPSDEQEAFAIFARAGRAASSPSHSADGSPTESTLDEVLERAPWRSSYLSHTNLPAVFTPFIGRAQVEAAARDQLLNPKTRLLTLTGAPGIGKTRLALQVASDLVDHFDDGVFFVELATVMDPELVLPTIARALGLREGGERPIESLLLDYLRQRRMLLVLDNFEQVLDAGPLLVKLLEQSYWVKMLVTSREALHLRAERPFAVPPLELPKLDPLPPLYVLSHCSSVELFVERAQAAEPDFQLTKENGAAVARVCVGLEGLPLAIELAAAHIRHLSPQTILHLLEHRLELLTGGAKDLPTRQQTLRNTIEWSYDLLSEGETQLFRRMAVFSGGCTLEAAEAVCNAPGPINDGDLENLEMKIEVPDGINSLVDKSLMYATEGVGAGGEPRYLMLETIHEYAWEKLGESGEAEEVRRQHALYFMRLAEEAEPQLRGGKQLAEWLDRLEEEHDNIRVALRWARERGRGHGNPEGAEAMETGLRLAGAIWRFWDVHGYFSEGREQLTRLLEVQPAQVSYASQSDQTSQAQGQPSGTLGAVRAKALHGAGAMAYFQGDYAAARSLHEESLALYRALGDKRGIAFSLNNLGNTAQEQRDYAAARSLHEESLAIRRELVDKQGIAASLNNLGNTAYSQGDYAAARSLYEESLTTRRELGHKQGIAASLSNLGNVAYLQGDYAAARSLYEESLTLFREIGHKQGIAMSLNNLGNVAQEQRDYAAARSLYEETMALFRKIGAKAGIAEALAGLGEVVVSMGSTGETGEMRQSRAARGARLLGAVEALLEAIGTTLDVEDRLPYERAVAAAREQLEGEEFQRAWEEGRAMSVEEAIAYAQDG